MRTPLDIKIIKTSGDIFQNKKISDIGGKGVFCKQIEDELLELKNRFSGSFFKRFANKNDRRFMR